VNRPEGISIVIPVFNERENLIALQDRLTQALEPLNTQYEVLYVDDGSTDGSWDLLRKVAAADSRVRLIRFRRNFGQTPALAAGLARTRHAVVVTLDADLQNDPADIPRLISTLGHSYDVVSGWRRNRHDPWWTRKLPSWVANLLIRLVTGLPLHDFGCTLKAYRREILSDVNLYGEMHRFLPVLAAWVGGRITELEVIHHPRAHGASKYGLLRIYKILVDVLTIKFIGDFSARPNYIFGGFGLVSLLLGTVAFAVVAHRVLVLRRLEATPLVFIMVVLFLTGVLSIFIGFLAEIVIRGFHDVQRRPTYYVRETVGLDPPD
jgi:glycosyltransferase involved in cell wall biosynthesis